MDSRIFTSIQDRFDATYVDTATEFRNRGFASPEEEVAFESDLKAAVSELAEKCPEGMCWRCRPTRSDGSVLVVPSVQTRQER